MNLVAKEIWRAIGVVQTNVQIHIPKFDSVGQVRADHRVRQDGCQLRLKDQASGWHVRIVPAAVEHIVRPGVLDLVGGRDPVKVNVEHREAVEVVPLAAGPLAFREDELLRQREIPEGLEIVIGRT